MLRRLTWRIALLLLVCTSCSSGERSSELPSPESELVCDNFEILEAGILRFEFSGDTSGVYETEGRFSQINSYVSVSISARTDIRPVSIFSRYRPEGVDGRQDFNIHVTNTKGVRTFSLPAPNETDYFRLILGNEEELYFITSGKIVLTEFSCDMIEGNFYAAASTSDGSKSITLKNGYFRAVQ